MNCKSVLSLFVLSCLVLFIGCDKNVRVGGTVSFADDGSPLTCGTIIFDNGQQAGRGKIMPDGSYTLGFEKISNGIPQGSYKVYIVGAVETTTAQAKADRMTGKTEANMGDIKIKNLIATKYQQASSTDLTATIDGRNTQCDFKVERKK